MDSMDLGTQIRDYAQAVDAAQEPMSPDEITQRRLATEPVRPVGPLASPVSLRPRSPWMAAAAAAVAALVLFGGGALLFEVAEPDAPVGGTVVPTALIESVSSTAAEPEPRIPPCCRRAPLGSII